MIADVNDGAFGEAAYCHHRHHQCDEPEEGVVAHSFDFDTCPHSICTAARATATLANLAAPLSVKTLITELTLSAEEIDDDGYVAVVPDLLLDAAKALQSAFKRKVTL